MSIKKIKNNYYKILFVLLTSTTTTIYAADVITNGAFDANITTGWTNLSSGSGTTSWDNNIGGLANGSMKGNLSGSNITHTAILSQSVGNINATDDVLLSLYWYKFSTGVSPAQNDMIIRIIKPSGDSVDIWTENSLPAGDVPSSGAVTDLVVSSLFNESGIYTLRVYGYLASTNDQNAVHQLNFDDIVLDISTPISNEPPVVTDIPNQTILEGQSFTTINLDDYVSDVDNTDAEMTWTYSGNTELTVDITNRVVTITIPDINWNGNETITFRATDPGSLWDEDPATFTVTAQNDPPVIATSATQVSPASVNAYGTNTTIISADFSDVEDPGVGAFTITFKVREPNNSTEAILVNALTNGVGGLTIIDNGSGSYTANYDWDPDDAQTLGLYDLYCEVSDGSDNAIDDFTNNIDELEIIESITNSVPVITAGATVVSVSPVNRFGTNFTIISVPFTDSDIPDLSTLFITFKIRRSDNSTEDLLVDNKPNGIAGITVTDHGGGSYTAQYTYYPGDTQPIGFYDLLTIVNDGFDQATDGYANNSDELEIIEILPNGIPTITAGDTKTTKDPVNRIENDTTTIFTSFYDSDIPPLGDFLVTLKIRQPDNSTEITLLNAATNGTNGLVITDQGGGVYTAWYHMDPSDSWLVGAYDLYCEVSDGIDNGIDDYTDNLDELNLINQDYPDVVAGNSSVSLSPVNRFGTETTTISTTFNDTDQPLVSAFNVSFKIRKPDNFTVTTLVDSLTHGAGGLTIVDNGGGSYTASYVYDPSINQTLGLYDIYFQVTDGDGLGVDDFIDNLDEFEINEIIPNDPPTFTAGATVVSVSPANRYGSNTTTISTDFIDTDQPGILAFNITFKIREPNNTTELILVNNLEHGSGGLVVTDNGAGSYTASYSYNPDDAQTLGLYDLYFEVYDGLNTSIDNFTDNLDELEINQEMPPQIVTSATTVSPAAITRIGGISTTISTAFYDADQPGVGAYTVTFKVREPDNNTEVILVNNLANGVGGLTITDLGAGNYSASYDYNPDDIQTLGYYDLYCQISDASGTGTDDYLSNQDELEILQQSLPTITPGATLVSVSPVNRYSTNTTTISANFSDADQPGVSAFFITLKLREPDNSTEVVLLNSQTNGNGGLTITDGGGGNYTASYVYDPIATQTIGLYDLYIQISDGTDIATDDFTNNIDELDISQQIAPTLVVGVTTISEALVNRVGTYTTTLSTTFTDLDQPGVNAFNVTFKIREPNNVTENILVNNLANGAGGLTIVDNGSGSYTASYDYDPLTGQALGSYDLYFEVSDGTDNVIDLYADNVDELTIREISMTTGATLVSASPINGNQNEATIISATFSDPDQPGVAAFNITFKLRHPDNTTERTLVSDLSNGIGGLTIIDNGGGSYTASYTFYSDVSDPVGTYDLYFKARRSTVFVEDNFTDNLDELEIIQPVTNNLPVIAIGAANVTKSPVSRIENDTTSIYASFSDADLPGIGAFTVIFKMREPDNATEIVLANDLANGQSGMVIVDQGGGVYTAFYNFDPADGSTLGLYDLYCEISDGTDNAIDDYPNNLDELEIVNINPNDPPAFTAGITSVSPASQDRFGAGTITLSSTFVDPDQPGVGAFTITFKLRAPFSNPIYTVADNLSNGESGMTITDNGGGSYTASISYDPPDNMELGYFDLYCEVSDGSLSGLDDYSDNTDELLITGAGENSSPVVPHDNTYPSPIAIERIGANSTTLFADFTDADAPAITVFRATFKVRLPDNSSEIVLADNAATGAGVTIVDQGGGVYTASVSWDPPDGQILGTYDLYFHVHDGTDTTYDVYSNNLDELELYDAISNNIPTVVSGNTQAIANSVNRIGSDFIMLKSTFDDVDMPGKSSFLVTFKVRDAGSTEYTIVDNSAHDQNGLRIRHVSGSTYEASVLWNPPDAQTTGDYDLYLFVDDQKGGTVTDDYISNSNELAVTSSAILGDGYLLHRSNNSDNCGGPNSACHNVADHNTQTCVTCHTPHGSKNIYMVRETITTPNSGDKPVLFKTLGIGDPFNSPDPIAGSDTHGAMADRTNTVYTEVCEVCHTSTKYFRNDGTQPNDHNHDVEDCRAACHTHADGFSPGAGAESSGGISCSCHSSIFSAMDSTSLTYRHILANDDANYSPGASGMYSIKNCLTCHVDHDIFRADLNPGIGQRSKNLRVDYETDPVIGNISHLSNSDYSSSGLGGLCLSCHSGLSCNGCHSPNKSSSLGVKTTAETSLTHNFVPKADFDASDAHNYNVPTTYSSDGSIFNANCTKCHNDNMSKSYQSSPFKVSLHSSEYMKMLDTNGVISPSDPIEEKFCFKCHSTTSNPNAGSSLDYFGVQSMPNSDALDIEETFTRTYTHPTALYSGRHSIGDSILTLSDGNRHAECGDCHNPHAAQTGTHDGSSNLVSGALKGVWGVEPTSWPAAPTPSDNANVFAAPSAYTKVEPATKEYQICLKCHSNYVTLPSGNRNLAEEINPNYPSTHGITIANQNPFCNTTTMFEPWGSSGSTYCSDCHRSNTSSDPEGPHGSNAEHLLVATIISDNSVGTPLCNVCHNPYTYWEGSSSASRFPQHPAARSAHKRAQGCFACHMWDYASTSGLGVSTTYWSGGNPPPGLFVHGQNKIWNFKDRDGSTGTGDPVDAFVNGMMSDIDYSVPECWSEVCKTHSGTNY